MKCETGKLRPFTDVEIIAAAHPDDAATYTPPVCVVGALPPLTDEMLMSVELGPYTFADRWKIYKERVPFWIREFTGLFKYPALALFKRGPRMAFQALVVSLRRIRRYWNAWNA